MDERKVKKDRLRSYSKKVNENFRNRNLNSNSEIDFKRGASVTSDQYTKGSIDLNKEIRIKRSKAEFGLPPRRAPKEMFIVADVRCSGPGPA
jgi:hypothetical protein